MIRSSSFLSNLIFAVSVFLVALAGLLAVVVPTAEAGGVYNGNYNAPYENACNAAGQYTAFNIIQPAIGSTVSAGSPVNIGIFSYLCSGAPYSSAATATGIWYNGIGYCAHSHTLQRSGTNSHASTCTLTAPNSGQMCVQLRASAAYSSGLDAVTQDRCWNVVGSPPVGSPPVGSPPVGSPPVGSPPVGSPPVGSPGSGFLNCNSSTTNSITVGYTASGLTLPNVFNGTTGTSIAASNGSGQVTFTGLNSGSSYFFSLYSYPGGVPNQIGSTISCSTNAAATPNYGVNVTGCVNVRPGQSFTIASRANNSGTGSGPNYDHQVGTTDGRVFVNGYSPSSGTPFGSTFVNYLNQPGIPAGGSGSNKTVTYRVRSSASPGTVTFTARLFSGATLLANSSSSCVNILEPLEYSYQPSRPTASTSDSRYYAGRSFTVSYTVTNTDTATGPGYSTQLNVTSGASHITPSSVGASSHGGLTGGASRAHGPSSFTIDTNAPHNAQVCFTADVSPAQGTVSPSSVTVSSRTSTTRCITIYNTRYNITTVQEDSPEPNAAPTFSPSTLLPGDSVTFNVGTCNTEPVPDVAGQAPAVTTTVSAGSHISGTTTTTNSAVARGSSGCIDNTFIGTVDPAAQLGDQACIRVQINRNVGFSDGAFPSGSQDRTFCVGVSEVGYVAINNGDAWAGGAFDPSPVGYGTGWCSVPGGAENGFIRSAFRVDRGAYASYSLGATDDIERFASAINPASGAIGATQHDLKFANTASPYGNVSSQGICATDYWNFLSRDLGDPNIYPAAGFPTGANRQGQYVIDGDLAITTPQQLQAGERITLVVDGDVTISEDITYGNYSVNSQSDIPVLMIVARGNIDIADTVDDLAGIYIVRPSDLLSSTDGVIDTCSNGAPASGPNAGRLSSSVCDQQLTIRGMFVANDIQFRRTYGGITGGNANGGQAPAEVFEFNAEAYLAKPFLVAPTTPNLPVSFLKDLPPVIN